MKRWVGGRRWERGWSGGGRWSETAMFVDVVRATLIEKFLRRSSASGAWNTLEHASNAIRFQSVRQPVGWKAITTRPATISSSSSSSSSSSCFRHSSRSSSSYSSSSHCFHRPRDGPRWLFLRGASTSRYANAIGSTLVSLGCSWPWPLRESLASLPSSTPRRTRPRPFKITQNPVKLGKTQ